jgi:hypothetical protein
LLVWTRVRLPAAPQSKGEKLAFASFFISEKLIGRRSLSRYNEMETGTPVSSNRDCRSLGIGGLTYLVFSSNIFLRIVPIMAQVCDLCLIFHNPILRRGSVTYFCIPWGRKHLPERQLQMTQNILQADLGIYILCSFLINIRYNHIVRGTSRRLAPCEGYLYGNSQISQICNSIFKTNTEFLAKGNFKNCCR